MKTYVTQSVNNYAQRILRMGSVMAQAVGPRPSPAEALLQSQVSSSGIFGRQSGTRRGFSPSTSVFLCQYHHTSVP
jgi:hypothetical protein